MKRSIFLLLGLCLYLPGLANCPTPDQIIVHCEWFAHASDCSIETGTYEGFLSNRNRGLPILTPDGHIKHLAFEKVYWQGSPKSAHSGLKLGNTLCYYTSLDGIVLIMNQHTWAVPQPQTANWSNTVFEQHSVLLCTHDCQFEIR
jgi:hypothetical protein